MSRNVLSTFGVGQVTPGEGTYLHAPLWGGGFRADRTQRFVQITHGHGALAVGQIASYTSLNYIMGELVRQGWIAGAGDFGGGAAWANDAAMASMLDLFNYSQTVLHCLPQIDGLGWSMGGLGLMNRVKRSPQNFRRVVLFAPALQIKTFHDKNPAGYGVEIEAAYGGAAAWQAGIVGHQPLLEIEEYQALFENNDLEVRIYHGDQDPTVPIQDSRNFVSQVDTPQLNLVELPGRDHVNLFGAINPDDVADFLEGKVAA